MTDSIQGSGSAVFSEAALRELIARRVGPDKVPRRIRTVMDTSDFYRVDYDDVVLLDGNAFLIRNHECEGRFGIDEQPKFWVRRSIDLASGETKILKMVFNERFTARLGDLQYECLRSPRKEARILKMVRGRPQFMQGVSISDSAGNIIRVLDYIHGSIYAAHVMSLGSDHEDYFQNHFPSVLDEFVELVEAIEYLHGLEQTHGDIRRDHIIRDSETGRAIWIDFDYSCFHSENLFGYDLAGLGNVLLFLAGRGDVTVQELKRTGSPVLERLRPEDMNIVFRNRVANLQKMYHYIPDALNMVLMHFSEGARVFYDRSDQLIEDIKEARQSLDA